MIANTITRRTAVLIAVAAFAAGSGITWLILRETGAPASPQPSTFVIQKPAGAGNDSGPEAPDVSQMSPAQSAVALGNWNYDNKDWPKAIGNYQRAISLGMDNPDVRTDLGNAFRFSGQPQKALEQYQIAQRENPQHENSLFNTAALYAEALNDPVNAANTWQEYLRRFPNGEKAPAARKFLEQALSGSRNEGQSGGMLQKTVPEMPK